MNRFLLVLVWSAFLLVPAPSLAQAGLKIIVVDGDEAANIVAEKIAAEPVIEVRDRDNRRVPNAVVRFLIRKTARNRLAAVFRNGQPEIRTLTDQAGRATADFVTPLEPGSFDIDVQVSYQGKTAKATIRQTNYPTTADAKAAGREPAKSSNPNAQAAAASAAPPTAGSAAAAAAGGGMSKLAVVGLVAGGAAGAGAAVVLSQRKSDSPAGAVSAVTASVTSGLQASTAFAFSVQATNFQASSLTYRWEFGDGATSTDPAPTHVYAASGSYTVVVTVSDARQSARSELGVQVHSAQGTWFNGALGGGTTLELVQSGSSIVGTELSARTCPLTGSVRSAAPQIVLSVPQCPQPPFGPLIEHEFRLNLSPNGMQLSGEGDYVARLFIVTFIRR